MKSFLAVLVLIFAVIEYGQAAREKGEKSGRTSVKVLGQSGKIRVSTSGKTDVVITFDEMKELDQSDAEVGKGGRMKHSFNTFASQEFNFSKAVKYEYNNLKTKTFNFTALIEGTGALLNVPVYIFMEEGEFVHGNETSQVKNGTVKFNIELSNWQFCNGSSNCKKGEKGEYVDLTIALSSKSRPKRKSKDSRPPPKGGKKRQEEYDVGGATLGLSKEIEVDGTLTEMHKDYPKHISRGSKELFIFRFPRFNHRVLYDPSITMEADTSSALSLGASFVMLLGALFAAIVANF